MEFAFVPAGKFLMGNRMPLDSFRKAAGHEPGVFDGYPLHEVELHAFYMGVAEVTVGQWRSFVHDSKYRTTAERVNARYYWNRPEFKQKEAHPVIYVSYEDALAFAEWLSKKDHILYRLPTEAEWEYACRAESTTTFPWSESADEAWRFANLKSENDRFKFTSPVKSFSPNQWGLYDMVGNVHEWCTDWVSADYYLHSPPKNPRGPDAGETRSYRGGSWEEDWVPRPHRRESIRPNLYYRNGGFRLARDVQSPDGAWQTATRTRWCHLTRRNLVMVGEARIDYVLGTTRWKVIAARTMGNRLEARAGLTPLKTSGKFIRVDFEVENVARDPVPLADCDLFDNQGRRYQARGNIVAYIDIDLIAPHEKLNPGVAVTFTQLYEVTASATDLAVAVSEQQSANRLDGVIKLGL